MSRGKWRSLTTVVLGSFLVLLWLSASALAAEGTAGPVTGLLEPGVGIPTSPSSFWYENGRVYPNEDGLLTPRDGKPDLTGRPSFPASDVGTATDDAGDSFSTELSAAGFPAAWHPDPEQGDALYAGFVEVRSTGSTGLKMNVNVYNRATLRDYYLLMMYNPNDANQHNLFAFEIAEYTENVFRPLLHIKYPDGSSFGKWYTGTSVPAGWHNIKIARQTNGSWNLYFNDAPLEYNLWWPTAPSSYWPLTQVESFYETQSETVWDPANHYTDVHLRTSANVWSLWTNASWGANRNSGIWAIDPFTYQSITSRYSYIGYVYNFYDWWLRR